VIAIDLRGFGRSSPVPAGFDFCGLVDDVVLVVEAFDLDEAVVVGHSMGGAIALGLAVGLLVRYGPAERRRAGWASVGAVAVVAAWIVQSLLFAWYVRSFANFTSASGALTVFLVLAAFLYTSSIIFLVGVEINELLRKDASEGELGIIGVLRRGMHP